MFRIVSSVCAAAMAVSVPFAAPAIAMPVPVPAYEQQGAIDVQFRRHPADMEWRGGRYYYRGHPGSRVYRRGYREYNGWWFPPAAFIAGAIIGGAIAGQQPPVRYRYVDTHVQWCYARYRSYREWDNTFQPYNGPRRQCISPYSY